MVSKENNQLIVCQQSYSTILKSYSRINYQLQGKEKKKAVRTTNTWRLNNSLLNNEKITEAKRK